MQSSVLYRKKAYNYFNIKERNLDIYFQIALMVSQSSVTTVWFGFFSVFHRLFRCRECSNRYDNTNDDAKHCPTSYLSNKKDLFKSMQPISRYSKNNKQLFWMVPKWLTSYFNYVINQWSTAFGPISNPSVFEVLYLVK